MVSPCGAFFCGSWDKMNESHIRYNMNVTPTPSTPGNGNETNRSFTSSDTFGDKFKLFFQNELCPRTFGITEEKEEESINEE